MAPSGDKARDLSVLTQRDKSGNLDAAPSVKSQFMKLAAEVHKDIANLRDNGNLVGTSNDVGKCLFNNSSAVRKLIVFLATANLKEIELYGVNLVNKKQFLLGVALQPQMQKCLPNDMKFESVDNMDLNKPGYKKENDKEVVYFSNRGIFESLSGVPENATKTIVKILSSVVSAVQTVSEAKQFEDQQFMKSGEVQDLAELDSKMKENINSVLMSCLQKKDVDGKNTKNFREKLKNAFRAFINFFGSGKKKGRKEPITTLNKNEKDGAQLLSEFFRKQNESLTRTSKEDNTVGEY